MCQQAREAYEAQVQLLKAQGIQLSYNTPLFQIPCQLSLARRWEKYQDTNGISPRITLYELRHTFVTFPRPHGGDPLLSAQLEDDGLFSPPTRG